MGTQPEGSQLITEYDKLRELVAVFAGGELPLLAIVGPPGTGKSQSLKAVLPEGKHLMVRGHSTAYKLYCNLYDNQNYPVVIDDADGVMSDRKCREYVKILTETNPVKTLQYDSARMNADDGVPSRFDTTSPCCIIVNDWKSKDPIYNALESRAEFVYFAPNWNEVYKEAARWFWDQEILDYVHEKIEVLKQPDVRLLVKAYNRKKAGTTLLNWRDLIDNYQDDEGGLAIRNLLKDKTLNNTQRKDRFESMGLGSRSTFYRKLSDIVSYAPTRKPKRLIVQGLPPEVPEVPRRRDEEEPEFFEEEEYNVDISAFYDRLNPSSN